MTAIRDVERELRAQDLRWGEQNHAPELWLAILTEEVGEVAKEVADASARGLREDDYRMEMVQVAAVAINAIRSFDRQRSK